MVRKEIVSVEANTATDDPVHRHPEVEHFVNLNTILLSLVDFIRPETFIAQDELQTYIELKDKFLRESTLKRKKQQQAKTKGPTTKSPLEVAGVQSIRTTSGIYRFLAHHHKNASATNVKKPSTPLNRDELLKKLHDRMPHRQQQQTENGVTKRKRPEKTLKDKPKKPRISTKEWTATPAETKSSAKKPSVISSQLASSLAFGRFEFGEQNEKHDKKKKVQTKKQKLIGTLKKVESEQQELVRLQKENPEEGKERLRSKNWETALAKAKGEKVRDNVQLLRKTIKKQAKRRVQSAKKWQESKSQVDKRANEKQEKRKANLQKRKDDRQAKLKKKMIKKGRLIS